MPSEQGSPPIQIDQNMPVDRGEAHLETDDQKSPTGNGFDRPKQKESGTHWRGVVRDVFTFTLMQHSARVTEVETRKKLAGPFIRDWLNSASSPFVEPNWSDGGKFFTNYIAHPMQGSVYGYIYSRNNPSAWGLEPGLTREYGVHLAKATAVSAAASFQFEIGPFSESSIGNVGMAPDRYKMAWVDLVVTPTLGTAWMVGEDLLDRYVIERLEGKIGSNSLRNTIRILLNPTRSFANVVGFERPWARHRELDVRK